MDQYCLGLSFNLPFELQKQTLALFIREVMPVFAGRARAAGSAKLKVAV